MPLQTTHRPDKLSDFVGNEALVESLSSVLAREKDRPHTFFFRGPSGCGKTTLGRIVANMVNCHDWDYHYFNASNTRGIDTVRDVLAKMRMSPSKGKVKVYHFEEAHMLTGPAQEAFLKDTEEPPDHVYFIFSTTEPEKMKVTFKRRAHVLEVKPLTQAQINKLLKQTLRKEKVENFPEKITNKIASVCNGSAGIAMSLLDSVIDIADNELAFKAIEEATLSESAVNQLCQTLLDPRLSPTNKWGQVRVILRTLPGEPETNRRAVLGYMTKVMLGKDNPSPEVFEIMAAFFDNYFYSGKAGLVASSYLACKSGGDIPF